MAPALVWRTRCGLAHARADGRETDCEAGADGGERWDPHGTVLAKTNVSSYSECAFSVRILWAHLQHFLPYLPEPKLAPNPASTRPS